MFTRRSVVAYDFWAELVSPLKTEFRTAFLQYAGEIYDSCKLPLTAYIPATMGGDMPREDYLMNMHPDDLPECILTMSFGECSHPKFAERILARGIYSQIEAAAYFPELMVVDTVRLGGRPIPGAYEELADDIYRGEIALIGSRQFPDPTVPLYIYRELGAQALARFAENIHAFAAPVTTIRHIGKHSNDFASIFIMPSLFAFACAEKPGARVVIPRAGAAAEPIILMSKRFTETSRLIRHFVFSDHVRKMFADKRFPMAEAEFIPIAVCCKKELICSELEEVYRILRENLLFR